MKFIFAVLFLVASAFALPGPNDGWGGQGGWGSGGWGTPGASQGEWSSQGGWGGYETCSTEYITATTVVYTPTTEYDVKTTYVPYTTQTKSEVVETTLITTDIIKSYTTDIIKTYITDIVKTYTSTIISSHTSHINSTYTSHIISTWTSECPEVITSSCTEEIWVPVTTSSAVVTTCEIPTSIPYTSTCVETQTVCCTADNYGNKGPWYTKGSSGGW
jgi:hypothetical protein